MLTFDNIGVCEDSIKIVWCNRRIIKRILTNACNRIDSNKIIELIKKYKTYLPINTKAITLIWENRNFEMFELLINIFGKNLPIDKKLVNQICKNNNTEIVKKLMSVFGKDLPIDENAIYETCKNGNFEILEMLVKLFKSDLPIDEREILNLGLSDQIKKLLFDYDLIF